MKILSIGTDRKLFDDNAQVFLRSKEYASKMHELHIIVFSLKSLGLKERKINNLYIYPTNSVSKLTYVFDAIRIGKKIITKDGFRGTSAALTCQDPFETGLIGVLLKKKFHIPLQLQVHTDFLSPYFRNSFLNKIRVMLAKYSVKKADGIRVVSSVISDSINNEIKGVKAKIDILPIFVNIDSLNNAISNRNLKEDYKEFEFIILMASRLTYEKRIDVALSSFKEVLKAFPKTGLLICGEGPLKKNLQELSNTLQISNNVLFLGWQNDLVSFYKSADLFLLTSEYEGYGMTLIEAGGVGLPIVTTNVGVAKTSLFKDGINSSICPVGDTDCISKSIINLIKNIEKRKSFSLNMRDSIKDIAISKEEYVKKYVSLLESILRK